MSPRKKASRVREEHATYAAEAPAPQSAEHARRIIDEQHTTYVSERDWEILVDLMDNPPPPNEALIRALQRSARAADIIGIFAVEVYAKPNAAAFYHRQGFAPLEDDRLHLYLPIRTIHAGLESL